MSDMISTRTRGKHEGHRKCPKFVILSHLCENAQAARSAAGKEENNDRDHHRCLEATHQIHQRPIVGLSEVDATYYYYSSVDAESPMCLKPTVCSRLTLGPCAFFSAPHHLASYFG